MRYIYVDEAGTSAHEPVTIVAGLIVPADKAWKVAESKVAEVIKKVPEPLRKNFVFHAKDIFNTPKAYKDWPLNERLEILHSMMSIPRELKIPIALGLVRRSSEIPPEVKLPKEQFQHIMSFFYFLGRADKYIRDHADIHETATVIAEDVPTIKKHLRLVLSGMRASPKRVPKHMLLPTESEKSSGVILQDSVQKVSRIIDDIHFVEKARAPLLQIADACAFGFRRYFAEQEMGKDFVRSMIGRELEMNNYAGDASGELFYWHAPKTQIVYKTQYSLS